MGADCHRRLGVGGMMRRTACALLCTLLMCVVVHASKEAWEDSDAVVELGEQKQNALLNSKKILPETQKQKDAAYANKMTLTTYASKDCEGKPLATRTFKACKKTPDMQQCPKDVWNNGYVCKKPEKKSDQVFSQKWSWTVYNGQFMLRYHTADESWKATEMGKSIGMLDAETCFTWAQDIQQVLLLQKLNAPSCKPVNSFGAKEKGKSDNGQAFLATSGSFKII